MIIYSRFRTGYQCLVLLWYLNTYNRLQIIMVSRGLVNTIAVEIVVVSTINNHEDFDSVPFYFQEKKLLLSLL